jgi:anaerobic selenocysteine-containing dehydrogenase
LELAQRVYPERAHLLGCATGEAIRQEIPQAVPFYEGIQNLKKLGDNIQYGGPHLGANWLFATADTKAHFRAVPLPQLNREPGIFEVSTRRGKQFNSLIYDETDPMTGADRDAVFINPEDAAELHLSQNDRVRLVNDLGGFDGRVFIAPIARRNLQVFWPEGNVIVRRGVVDALGGVPDYNAQVKIEKR